MSVRDYHLARAPSGEQFAAEMRSVENPSTPLSAGADWMYDVFGAVRSASGVRVNRKTVFTYGPVWRAVNLLASDTAKLKLFVHKHADGDETKTRDRKHPAYRLLRRKPNSEQTAFAWKLLSMAHTLVEGNGYSYIFRLGSGAPDEIIPLLPDRTYPVRKNGVLWYVTTVNGEMRRLAPEDVLHFKGLGFDGLAGYPLYQFARDSFGLGMAAQKFGGKFFANNAEPSAIIEVPGTMDEKAILMLRESWDRMHGGLENSHRPAVLEEGVKLKPYGSSAKQAQLLELMQYSAKEVANWFGLPVHKLGDTDTTSYASLEQENQAYLDEALDRWLVQIEEECWDKLLTEEEKARESHSIDFDRLGLVRANLSERVSYYTGMSQIGAMNRDEIRARENMNPIPDGEGKKFLTALNMGEVGDDDEDGDGAGGSDEPDGDDAERQQNDSHRLRIRACAAPIVMDSVARMVRRLAVAGRKAAKRPERFATWLDEEIEDEHRATLVEVFAPLAEAIRAAGMANFAPEMLANALFFRVRKDFNALSASFDPKTLGPAIEKHLAENESVIARELSLEFLPERLTTAA